MNYRDLFAGIETIVKLSNGKKVKYINFDNGATTPPLKCVVDAINDNIKYYGPIARGSGQKGDYCTEKFEEARNTILKFFNVDKSDKYTAVFTKSATEGLNILANVLIDNKNDVVLTTRMEHHANDLPWRDKCRVDYIKVDELGRISLDEVEKLLKRYTGKVKYVSITGAANTTGYVNPIHEVAKLCHKYDAKIIVDAAQLLAHREINMLGENEDEQIDFLAFSAHKAYAPFGSGAIVGLKNELSKNNPYLKGGGCVDGVYDYGVVWNDLPHKLEAGTQNFFGSIALAEALNKLKSIGFKDILYHENKIKDYLINEMKKIDNVILYADTINTEDRLGVICFNIEGKHFEDVAKLFADEEAIALRSAKFCAHPYVNRLLGVADADAYEDYLKDKPDVGMIRLSLGLYNTLEEAEIFVEKLTKLASR